jgi:hypothetical protein
MKKYFLLFILLVSAPAFFVVARASGKAQPVAQAAPAMQATQYATPTFVPTRTEIPTPTIGYEATIAVAQMTADEARRVNAEATAAHEQHILSIMHITSQAEERNQEVLSWTAQAAPTIIPLTATQQAAANTQVAAGETRVSGMMTATHQAPTQYAAMVNAQSSAQWASLRQGVNVAAMFGLFLFLLAMTAYFVRVPPGAKVQPDVPRETVVQIRNNTGAGTYQQVRAVVPCSPEQLTELAELAANGEKRFGINRLETHSRTFRGQRPVLLAVRQFLIDHEYVIADANGAIALNASGEAFLAAWFDEHKLSDDYEFAEPTPPPPPLHDHDAHAHDENPHVSTMGEWQKLNGGGNYTKEGIT